MEMSNARQLAIIPSHGVEEAVACPRTQQQQDRKLKPHPEQALKCPRCASTNTKFCYYNNYSFFQPRYFCKGCRRYWTQGGTLRNVPVGGGCRKKRSSSSSSKKAQDQDLTNSNPLLPPLITAPPFPYDPSDFTLAFACHPKQHLTKQFGLDDTNHNLLLGNTNTDPLVPSDPAPANGFLDILSNGLVDITSPSAFYHNLYSGFGASGSLEMATGVSGEEGGLSFEAVLSDATASTTTSQGSCRAMDGGDNKELVMDLRLQDGNMDSKRDCWINGIGSSWQGLINSSLL